METLDTRLAELLAEFELAGGWNDRYRLMVDWGEELEQLSEGERLPTWEVAGCSSPLWLRARQVEGLLEVRGASPGLLPRALLAVVCRLFDGLAPPATDVAAVVEALGLRRNLSPTRHLVLEHMIARVLEAGR